MKIKRAMSPNRQVIDGIPPESRRAAAQIVGLFGFMKFFLIEMLRPGETIIIICPAPDRGRRSK
jgi:hypothetical protein